MNFANKLTKLIDTRLLIHYHVPMNNILSTIQLAEMAGATRASALNWVKGGKIPSTRDHAGRWLVTREDAEAFVAARKLVGPKPAGERND